MGADHFWMFFQFLHAVEDEIPGKKQEEQVGIKGVLNLRTHPISEFEVSMPYGDVVLVICMLHDYIKMLDEIKQDDIQWRAYYRVRFEKMANRLAEQIGYDYEAALKKCNKKQEKENRSDIGEDAMALAVKYGSRKGNGGKANENQNMAKEEDGEGRDTSDADEKEHSGGKN